LKIFTSHYLNKGYYFRWIMRKINKVFSLILIATFLCQNMAFCLSEESFSLRPIMKFSKQSVNEEVNIINSAKAPDFIAQTGDRVEVGGKQFIILEYLNKSVYKAEDPVDKKTVLLKFQYRDKEEAGYERDFFDKVSPHDNIARGYFLTDESGNILIVIDFTEGEILDAYIEELVLTIGHHETYFNELFPDILDRFIGVINGKRMIKCFARLFYTLV